MYNNGLAIINQEVISKEDANSNLNVANDDDAENSKLQFKCENFRGLDGIQGESYQVKRDSNDDVYWKEDIPADDKYWKKDLNNPC